MVQSCLTALETQAVKDLTVPRPMQDRVALGYHVDGSTGYEWLAEPLYIPMV